MERNVEPIAPNSTAKGEWPNALCGAGHPEPDVAGRYRCWFGKPGAEDPPARADVEPLDLAKFLPQPFPVEGGPGERVTQHFVGLGISCAQA